MPASSGKSTARTSLLREPRFWVEAFCIANLAFLVLDVWIAHAVNEFAERVEWVPVVFSGVGAAALVLGKLPRRPGLDRAVGLAVGFGAIAVGLAGMVLHLEGTFFARTTLASLVYTAPFAAPLAFAGIGLVLVLDRVVPADTRAWRLWVLLFALGGWGGNFALALADHAQNGFFHASEWIPVVASAVAVGALAAPFFARVGARYLRACLGLMALEVGVGVAGFALHVLANADRPGDPAARFIHGAPAFAPLLFADLAVLAAIALFAMLAADRRR